MYRSVVSNDRMIISDKQELACFQLDLLSHLLLEWTGRTKKTLGAHTYINTLRIYVRTYIHTYIHTYVLIDNMGPNVMTKWLSPLFHISEVMDSNLCPQTGYHVDIRERRVRGMSAVESRYQVTTGEDTVE
jgi:hypothetical protein